MERLRPKLIVDGKGTEEVVLPQEGTRFTDKKISLIDEERYLQHLSEATRIAKESQVAQHSGEITLSPVHPDLPVFVSIITDEHKGSLGVDYESLNHVRQTIRETPNFYELNGGDSVDNFVITHKSAMTGSIHEDAISPEAQGRLSREIFKKMDSQKKLLGLVIGNHDKFTKAVGYGFDTTWLENLSCPILQSGGVLTIHYGKIDYKIFLGHKYKGIGGENPTNAFHKVASDYPDVDVIVLGHVHKKHISQFNKSGRTRIGVVGGTFKLEDEYAQDLGYPYEANNIGGATLALYPESKRMQFFWTVDEAKDALDIQLKVKEYGRKKGI